MSATARFALPLLSAGQAQKELYHNEALTLLDALTQGCVEAAGNDIPPADPAPGACWIVGAAPTGAWIGAAEAVAVWTASGWRFAAPRAGMAFWVRDAGLMARYGDGGWAIGAVAAAELIIGGVRVVGPRRPAIASPAGGATIDVQCRTAIAAILATLGAHGLIAS